MVVTTMRGFEAFMDSATEGWSLVAVRTPIDRLARAVQRRDEVLVYEPDVSFRPLRGNPILRNELHRRRAVRAANGGESLERSVANRRLDHDRRRAGDAPARGGPIERPGDGGLGVDRGV